MIKHLYICNLNREKLCDLHDYTENSVQNVKIRTSLNEIAELSFDLPINNKKSIYLQNENLVLFEDEYYLIKTPTLSVSNDGRQVYSVVCKHLSDILASNIVSLDEVEPVNVITLMKRALIYDEFDRPTQGWQIGTVTVDRVACRGLEAVEESCFSILLSIAEKYDGVVTFNSKTMTVDMTPAKEQSAPVINLRFSKNLKGIEVSTDTSELVTRLYCYGGTDENGNDIDIMSVNPTKMAYIDNFSYFLNQGYTQEYINAHKETFVRTSVWRDDSFYDPADLYKQGLIESERVGKPIVDIKIDALASNVAGGQDISKLKIGDCVSVYDNDLGIDYVCNIISHEKDYNEPHILHIEVTNAITYVDTLGKLYLNVSKASNVMTSGGTVKGNRIDGITVSQVKDLSLYYLNAEQIDAKYVTTSFLTANYINANEIHTKYLTATEIGAMYATITNLEAAKAYISQANIDIAEIKTLISGSTTTGDLQTIVLNATNATIDKLLVKNQIASVITVNDLLAGTISTNKFSIASDNGGIKLTGNLQQWFDKAGKIRLQAGQDASGNFTFAVFGSDGKTTYIDQNGIHEKAIPDGIIVDKMIGDNANISGDKININSLVTEINGSTEIITSSHIQYDGKSLDVAFDNIKTSVSTVTKTVTDNKSKWDTASTNASNALSKATSVETRANSGEFDGKGVKTTAVTYQASASGTTAPTGTWTTAIPTVSAGQYLWTRTIITYTDNTSTIAYSVAKMAINGGKGDKGDTGATGNGISSIASYYLASASASGVTTATAGWTTTPQAVSTSKKYHWSYQIISYTNGSKTTTTPAIIGVYGDTGAKGATGTSGKGINSVTPQYYLSTSNTTQTGGSWKTTQDTWSTGKYYWSRDMIVWSDNATTYTTPTLATGLNNANANAQNAITQVTTVTETVKSQSTQITAQEGKISTLITDTTQVKKDITAVRGDVTTAKGNITNLQTNYSSLQQTVSGLNSTVGSHTSQLTTIKGTADSALSLINGLEIGGRNLAVGTNKGVSHWGWSTQNASTTTGTTVIEDGINCCKFVRNATAAGSWSVIVYDAINRKMYQPNKKYTISFEVKGSVAAQFSVSFKEGNGTNDLAVTPVTTKTSTTNVWTKLFVTITTKSTLPSSTSQKLYMTGMSSAANVWYIFRNLKIEEGTKPTAWSPAPEDIDSSISSVDGRITTEIKTVTDKYTALQTDINGFKATVSSTYATKAQLTTVDGKFANYSATTAMNAAIKASADSITSTVSKTYATQSSLNGLTTRVTAAESKITDTAIVSTVTKSSNWSTLDTKATDAQTKANNLVDLTTIKDTRSVNNNPQWYFTNYPRKTVKEFKTCTAIGISGEGTYGTLETSVSWSSESGGWPVQLFYPNNSQNIYRRTGASATAWGAWIKVAGSHNITSVINQTADTVKISASKIELTGAVTFSSFNSSLQGKIDAKAEKIYHTTIGTSGTAGHCLLCQIAIAGTYQNQPIEITTTQRGKRPSTVWITFNNENSADPTLGSLRVMGDAKFYIVKNTTSLWDLYIQKSESYDNISVIGFNKGSYMGSTSVTWKSTQVATLPTGYVAATQMIATAEWCYNNDITYINGGKIYTGSVTANQIAANTITSTQIASRSITADRIKTGAITTNEIATGTIVIGDLNSSVQSQINTSVKRIKTTIDLSGSAYNTNTYYPVVGTAIPGEGYHPFECNVQLNSGTKPPWSSHASGFTCNLKVQNKASGWGTTNANGWIEDNASGFCDKMPAYYNQMTNSSLPVFYLRGGGKYYLYTDYSCAWSVKTSTFTTNSQSVAPTTAPANLSTLYNEWDIAGWCHSSNRTYINGAKIYTGTITADHIASRTLNAINITGSTITGTTITGGSITSNTSIDVSTNLRVGDNITLGTNPGIIKTIYFNSDTYVQRTAFSSGNYLKMYSNYRTALLVPYASAYVWSSNKTAGLNATNNGGTSCTFELHGDNGYATFQTFRDTYGGTNMSYFKEANNGRTILRPDANGGMYLGTTGYRWNTGFFTNSITASDLKEKQVLQAHDMKARDFIMAVKPIAYHRIGEGDTGQRIHYGFGAQTVAQTIKSLNLGNLSMVQASIINDDGTESPYHGEAIDDSKLSWGLNYNEFIPPMVSMLQMHENTIAELNSKIVNLQSQINELRSQINQRTLYS